MTASGAELHRRAEAAQQQARAAIESARRLGSELDRDKLAPEDRQQRLLNDWPYARLLARLETLPTIEQAKGIVMEQSQCTAAEAFDILRRASQRSNIPVRELSARIVAGAIKIPQE